MGANDPENFSCDGCGKSYRWKPEFAGRRIKCKCGFVMTAPKPAPVAVAAKSESHEDDEPDFDALYSLAAEGKQAEKAGAVAVGVRCPSCRAQLEPGAAVCTQCGFNLRTGKKSAPGSSPAMVPAGGGAAAATAGKPGAFGFPGAKRPLQQVNTEANPVLEIYLPLAVLGFGIFGVFAQYMWFNDVVHNFAGALPWVVGDILISCVLLAIGCLVAIQIVDVAFGSPGPAALKIAAIALGPSAVWGLVTYMIGGIAGYWAGRVVAMVLFATLFYLFFDMDTNEIISIGAITFLIRMYVAPLLVAAFIGALFASGGGVAALAADQAARNDDNYVQESIDNRPTDDAMPWLNDSGNRMFAHSSHSATLQLVQDLTSFGCTKATVIAIKGDGDTSVMWVKLPRDKAKRQQAVDCYNKFAKEFHLSQKKDTGQTYLLMTTRLAD